MPRYRMYVAAVAAGLVASAIAGSATASPIPEDRGILTKVLVPMKGSNAAATGEMTVQVDPKARKLCYAVDARGLEATDLSVQKGGATIIKLTKNRAGNWDGCADIAQDLGLAIVANPNDYAITLNNGALSAKLGG